MGKKDRRSHDQKRKAKLTKQARKHRGETSVLAYAGNKYKKDEFVPLMFRTEVGIHEADVISQRQLSDHDVRVALEDFVGKVREEGVPPPDYRDEVAYTVGKETELVYWSIRRNWENLFKDQPDWNRDDIVGVLRTLLGSLEVWGAHGARSRGYLAFLEAFMKKGGVQVRAVREDGEEVAEPQEDPMLEVGRDWYEEGGAEAGDEFRQMADQRIRAGDAESVVDICQQLIGEVGMDAPEIMMELSSLSIQAQRSMQKRLS